MIQFDPTITLGTVFQTVSFVGVVLAFYFRLTERIKILETKVSPLWDEFLRGTGEPRFGRK
jgi:hypothetical protein